MSKFYLIIGAIFFMSDFNEPIFDFNSNANTSNWRIVDDVVMGGKSEGSFKVNKDGNGEFSGFVSLENNGGFSSLRYRFSAKDVSSFNTGNIRVKGDGCTYQFRVKDNTYNNHSYISYFDTNTEWQTISIKLSDMYPTFRGRKLKMDNFSSDKIEEIAFLIGNKTEQNFKLEIDKIYLQ
jgi:hypothetical protein